MPSFRELFADPPASFRPQPFYFLNHRCTAEGVREQLGDMAAKGVGGAVLHCRHGLLLEYMSAEWLELIGACVAACQEHGLEAWLYDEDDWPSGTVGGALTRAHPEFRMRYVRAQEIRARGGANLDAAVEADDNTLLAVQASRYVLVGGVPKPTEDYLDLTAHLQDGRLRWQAPPGDWLIVVFWECPVAAKVTYNNGYYLDTMNPEAVAAFRAASYDPYRRFAGEFGGTIKGVFTDEPGLMIHDAYVGTGAMRTSVQNLHRELPGQTLAWTRDFLSRFRELKGYDLLPKLRALLFDIGPETNCVRADYFDAITTWYVEAYHEHLSAWCAQRGLDYIGHTLEDPLYNQVRTQGNQTRVLECFHRTGLDYLGAGVGTRENPYRILATKCASSVAHVVGRRRVMCEAVGGSGHQHTMADRRLDASFMAALGVNMFIPHAFYYSFQGYRKTDWPPTEFTHSPTWPWYHHFAGYLARLSLFGASGTHVTSAALLSPVKTVYVDMWRDGQPNTQPRCQRLFDRVSDLLLRLHHDYDYIDDAQLPRSTTQAGRLAFPGSAETYPLVILPAVRVMSVAGARRLAEHFRSGGRLLALGELPSEADTRGDDAEVHQAVAEVFGPPRASGPWVHEHPSGGKAIFAADEADLERTLETALRDLVEPDVVVTEEGGTRAEDVICCHRTLPEVDLYLFVNRRATRTRATAELRRPVTTGALLRLDLETGQVCRLEAGEAPGPPQVALDLEPGEACLIGIGAAEESDPPAPPAFDPLAQRHRLTLPPPTSFTARGGNVAILDTWEYTPRDLAAAERLGVTNPGQVNTYRTRFHVASGVGCVKLVLDDLQQWIPSHVGFLARKRSTEVFLNGEKLPPLQPATWQDPHYLEVDVGPYIRPGENVLEIATISLLNPMHGLTEPAYLVGEFALVGGRLIAAPPRLTGLWNEAGYPHFSGIGTYEYRITLAAHHFEAGRLFLDCGPVHDACRLVVNGQEVAVRLWPPSRAEITAAARVGENRILIEVANSLANLYGKQNRASGLERMPEIICVP